MNKVSLYKSKLAKIRLVPTTNYSPTIYAVAARGGNIGAPPNNGQQPPDRKQNRRDDISTIQKDDNNSGLPQEPIAVMSNGNSSFPPTSINF